MEGSYTEVSCVRSLHSKRETLGPHNSCRLPRAQCATRSPASSIEPRAHSSVIESADSSSVSDCPVSCPFPTLKDLVNSAQAISSSKRPPIAPSETDHVNSNPKRPPTNPCECDSNDVGHSSHIPRLSPPKPSTCSVPLILSNTVGCDTFFEEDEDLFGMVKLKHNDVCYTNGTIEWVGRKRTFPLNTGFKTIGEIPDFVKEPLGKKMRKGRASSDKTYTVCGEDIRECDCVDMLPTIYSIVDHLNALHDTVDIVDMRLNTLEDIVKDK